ncbi:MAG TPA: hypothetical protein ENJ82_01295 [Bacteroidetes bacterium]|nr:hypothetical protein [Bacteroidota bacterium]
MLNTLALTFDMPLKAGQIPAFRGAIAHLAGLRHDVFHNHDNDFKSPQFYKNRYPLVQYRVSEGRAAIFGCNEGATALEALQKSGRFAAFEMRGQHRPLHIAERVQDRGFAPQVLPQGQFQAYQVKGYLPFKPEKYQAYQATEALSGRIAMLERLLCNHIVAFAYGIGWKLPQSPRLQVQLYAIDQVHRTTIENRPRTNFDLTFGVNATLPAAIGIGQKTAYGFGQLEAIH